MSVTNDDDISSHIIKIRTLGSRLRKLFKNGLIAIEDIQTASLIASLPESFTSVTSPFEQREDAKFEDVSKAVKGHIMTRKNRANQLSANPPSTANSVKIDSLDEKVSSSGSKSHGKKRVKSSYSGPGLCTHCKGKYHDISTCMQKKNKDLSNKVDALIKQMASGKANLA